MGNLQEYKCPCCGGAIEFNSKLQKMKCPYCDTEFEIETLQGYEKELQNEQSDDMTWETSAGSEWQEGEAEGLRVYTCKSCGGEIVADANTAATSCPYCNNPIVMTGQFEGSLRPDYVIPFKLDKKAAKEGLMKHLSGKRLLPKIFKDQNHIDEIKGVYVPFWLFDTDAEAHIRYRATKVRSWSDSEYDYTETKHYMIHRGGTVGFERIPVDGSSKMPDDLMESIEPFDFKEAVKFQMPYLAGYLADKYDVSEEESVGRANKRVKSPRTLLDILQEEKAKKYSGGIYHKTQIELTYNSNHMEGSKLTHDQTRYIFETNTIGMENEVFNVDDIIETANHFRCIDLIIDNAKVTLTEKFIKNIHLILKNGTSDSRKDWFAVGNYKRVPNEVGGMATASPEEVSTKMKVLLGEYARKNEITFEDILDFHVKFERIHPFQDGNGRVGRLLMFKECLKHNIVPFIIEDDLKMFYYRGLKEWNREKGYLMDTCLTAQDRYKAYLDYFRIPY